jgi:predicted DCC family thiol-disulfide oxidoreductase YuxK
VGRHLVLFDGVCGLCNGLVQFVLPRDRDRTFDFAPLQSATGRTWLERFQRNPDNLETLVVVTDYRTDTPAVRTRADAALFVVRALRQPWRLLGILRMLPARVLDVGYNVIARRRYRWFGRYDACVLPPPEQRARFIDM